MNWERLAQLWNQGGWVLGSIIAGSMLGWTLAVSKWWYLRTQAAGDASLARHVLAAAEQGRFVDAKQLCQRRSDPLSHLLGLALSIGEPQRRWFARRLEPMVAAEREAMRRHSRLIGAIIRLLPLLGLLGTVLGMRQTFTVLMQSRAVEVDHLAGGICRALITTQAGLVAAVPLMLVQTYLNARIENCLDTLTWATKRLQTIRCHEE